MKKFLGLKWMKRMDFFRYAEEEIIRSSRFLSRSTIKNYRTAVTSFKRFMEGKSLRLSDIDTRLLADYEKYLLRQHICLNTSSCYLRSLRSLYNRAVEEGLVEQRHPFDKVFTGNCRTNKRGLSVAEVRRLYALSVPSRSFGALVRDVFLFCLFACGMPLVDVAYLKKSQIKDGRICYHRRKTAQEVSFRILPCMQQILDRYLSIEGEYVFPLLKRVSDYPRLLLRFNRQLAVLGRKAKLHLPLTSYVARHTWAGLAYEMNIGLGVISKGLGHTNARTTQIYLSDLGNSRLDAANRKLCREIVEKETIEGVPLEKRTSYFLYKGIR